MTEMAQRQSQAVDGRFPAGNLATDTPASPHLLAPEMKAEVYGPARPQCLIT